MKTEKYIVFCAMLLALNPVFVSAQEGNFPSGEQVTNAKAGDLILQEGIVKYGSREYKADYGTMVLPENRNNPSSRLITIPVLRIYSGSPKASNPVFLLRDGPGESNIWKESQERLLYTHDVVMVGYRGVDGSVSMKTPEVVAILQNIKNPLSTESLRQIGQAVNAAIVRIKSEGVDLEGYTILEVVDDIEMVRKALGYKKINLLGAGYGTRVAYNYGLRYRGNINRSVMYAVSPPGHFIWEPQVVEAELEYYNTLWKGDAEAVAKSPDILQTMRNVFASMPAAWNEIPIDPDKVRIAAYMELFQVNSAVMVFDAFVAAEKGDYSGIAYLSALFDLLMQDFFGTNWVEPYAKMAGVDYDPARNYEAELMPEGAVLGSPMAKLIWGALKYCDYQFPPAPDKSRKVQNTDVSTLIVTGSIDVTVPFENAKKMQSFMKNGRVVVLKEMAHGDDIAYLQPAAFYNLIEAYFTEGRLDVTKFAAQPVSFEPGETFQELAKEHFAK